MGFPALTFNPRQLHSFCFNPQQGFMGFPALQNGGAKIVAISVSIPSRGLWVFPLSPKRANTRYYMFQSLVGVYGFSRANATTWASQIYEMFQSLVGVYGFSREIVSLGFFLPPPVSIPSRGLWVFPQRCKASNQKSFVPQCFNPQQGFMGFPANSDQLKSLVSYSFNPQQGFMGFPALGWHSLLWGL